MEKSRGDENKRRKKSREGVETTRDVRKKKRREYIENNGEEKVFCLWRFWAYCLLL